jgi:hypothetical protein
VKLCKIGYFTLIFYLEPQEKRDVVNNQESYSCKPGPAKKLFY